MASSGSHHHHQRSSSPGRRAINNNTYGRYSDIGLNTSSARESYGPSRGSGDRLAPPAQTFIRDSRTDDYNRNDEYYEPKTRTRRSTFSNAVPPALQIPRSTPSGRPSSPLTSTTPKVVRKTYVIGDSKTTLSDKMDVDPRSSRDSYASSDRLDRPREADHRRRTSTERAGYVVTTGSRGEKVYHLLDPQQSHRDSVLQAPYTDSAGGHRAEDPYAAEARSRVRRSSTAARERPKSFVFDSKPDWQERDSASSFSRVSDPYNDANLRAPGSRHSGMLDSRRTYEQPPSRILREEYVASPVSQYRSDTGPPSAAQEYDRTRDTPAMAYPPDTYAIPAQTYRRDAYDRSPHDDAYDTQPRFRDQRESRNPERGTSQRYQDASVERRGFGLRPASTERAPVERAPVNRASVYQEPERRPPPVDKYYDHNDSGRGERRADREGPRGSRDDVSDYEYEQRRTKARSTRHHDYERDRDSDRDRGYDRDYDHGPSDRTRERDHPPRHDKQESDKHRSMTGELLSAVAVGGIGATGAAAFSRETARRDKYRDSESSDSGDSSHDRASRRAGYRRAEVVKEPIRSEPPRTEPLRSEPPRSEPPRSEPPRSYPAHDVDVVNTTEAVPKYTPVTAPPASARQQGESSAVLDADEEYRRRLQQAQEVYRSPVESTGSLRGAPDPMSRAQPLQTLDIRSREPDGPSNGPHLDYVRSAPVDRDSHWSPKAELERAPQSASRSSPTPRLGSSGSSEGTRDVTDRKQVRIVEPSAEPESKPKGILKRPKDQFPEHPNSIREGVAPLKDKQQLKGIPANARWTKIKRELVNVEALEEAGERFEEQEDHVIVLRVLNTDDIHKLAERTQEIRARRRRHRTEDSGDREARRQSRRDRDEYSDSSSDDEFSDRRRAPRMLEAGSSAQAPPMTAPSSSATAPPRSVPGTGTALPTGGYPTAPSAAGEEYRRSERDY